MDSYNRKAARNSNLKLLTYMFGLIIVIYVLVFLPTPYVIYEPGSAEDIKPFVSVKNGDTEEKGTFMLTTVLRKKANVALMLGSVLDKNEQLAKENLGGRTEQEYATEQIFNMSNSQTNAIVSAYVHAKIPFDIKMDKLVIIYNNPKLATKNDFQSGDQLLSLDGVTFKEYDELINLLKTKKVGDVLKGKVLRNKKETDVTVELIALKDEKGNTRPGMGVNFGIEQKVVPRDSDKEIEFKLKDIGGPSAGLMFTLELYNQLTPGDLSKGYRIAGTGTMSPDGTVGPIGGIPHKIVAADREKADIFFAPAQNYDEAKKKYDTMKTDMKLVKVSTVDEALKYLEALPVKGK
ncbi:peptidase S16 [Paenibacillus selenitireducens]|uniref:endopeptidase La n=1 Tax=Paenibacillus selenitireducens TaxID=1324314 RepID=A0A1T2XCX4_9BACL|nr:PDZ domain-containing protein [Paenibacillus selenitireducens]OPA77536.1 peptidase S16 [Paenibacillus selenitireducens]